MYDVKISKTFAYEGYKFQTNIHNYTLLTIRFMIYLRKFD